MKRKKIMFMLLVMAAAAFTEGVRPLEKCERDSCQAVWAAESEGGAGEPYSESEYEVETPRLRDAEQIEKTLKKLARKYPELEYIYENADVYPENLLAALCNNPEMADYVRGYQYSEGKATGGLRRDELSGDVPLLLQWDKRWGYVPYGDNTIALSGCAPTCVSMVAVALTGDASVTPDFVAAYAMENDYYAFGEGTKWTFMREGCLGFGIESREFYLDKESIFRELDEGHPIICSMRPGDFTTSGHFIVLTGRVDDKIRVNDPNCISRSRRLWTYEELEPQIKNLWVFSQKKETAEGEQKQPSRDKK